MKKFDFSHIGLCIKMIKDAGGEVYDQPYHLNIIGFRSPDDTDTFNDSLFMFWWDNQGVPRLWYPEKGFTTDPSVYYRQHSINTAGTAILVPGWYPRLWRKGLHRGQYLALVQSGPCNVYRDSNGDKKLDMEPKTVEKGYFGINLHRASPYTVSAGLGKYSAGCQVLNSPNEFNYLLDLVENAELNGQRYFSYLLVNDD